MIVIYRLLLLHLASTALCSATAISRAGLAEERFRTEPEHDPLIWNVQTLTPDRSLLAPGYYFFAPNTPGDRFWGPKIYDVDGHLIWDGLLTSTNLSVSEFRVCDWKGETGRHLCVHEDHVGNRVFDATYTQVGNNYTDTGEMTGCFPGAHEFNMLSGGNSFLYPINENHRLDLRPWGGVEDGWVKYPIFQEADVYTGKPFFTWHSLEHLHPWDTYIFPSVPKQTNLTSLIAGTGAPTDGWDWLHMNAIDKNAEGDYLVSGRHLDAIIKVAGPNNAHGLEPGTTIWQLGGKQNEFEKDFVFSRQHDVRFLSTGPTGDVLSLFDNAWEGVPANTPTANVSSGMIISVNNETMKATLLKQYFHPEGLLSGSRGGFDVLPNKNTVAGWGHKIPHITEYAEDGTVLFHVHYEYPSCPPSQGCGEHSDIPFSYRAHKLPWVGKPSWSPKLLAYSRTCDATRSSLVAYASWNGATEIKDWHFYTAQTIEGPWTSAGIHAKEGFETAVDLPSSSSMLAHYVRVEALDVSGEILGSVSARTFVPDETISNDCDDYGCARGFRYDEHNGIDTCQRQTPIAVSDTPPASTPLPAPASEDAAAPAELAPKPLPPTSIPSISEPEPTLDIISPAASSEPTKSQFLISDSIPLILIVPVVLGAVSLLIILIMVVRSCRTRSGETERGVYEHVNDPEMYGGLDKSAFYNAEEEDADDEDEDGCYKDPDKFPRTSVDEKDDTESFLSSSSSAG